MQSMITEAYGLKPGMVSPVGSHSRRCTPGVPLEVKLKTKLFRNLTSRPLQSLPQRGDDRATDDVGDSHNRGLARNHFRVHRSLHREGRATASHKRDGLRLHA